MSNSRKLLFMAISIILIVGVVTLQLEKYTKYETTSVQISNIETTSSFTTQLYPKKYAKIELENYDQISSINVKQGDIVKKGDLLVQLDDSEEQENYELAWANFNQLASTRSQARESSAEIQTELVNAKTDSEDNFRELEELVANSQLDSEYQSILLTSIESAQNTTELMYQSLNGNSTDYISSTLQPAINLAYQNVQSSEKRLEERKIKAPFNGQVLYIETEKYMGEKSKSFNPTDAISEISTGNIDTERILDQFGGLESGGDSNSAANSNFIVIANLSEYYLYPTLPESEIFKIEKDQEVEVNFKSINKKGHGVVTKVANFPNSMGSGEPEYSLEVKLNEPPKILPIGSTVQGEIVLEKKLDTKVLPLGVINYNEEGEPFVYILKKDNSIKEVYVELGTQSLTEVEVENGFDKDSEVVIDIIKTRRRLVFRQWVKEILQK